MNENITPDRDKVLTGIYRSSMGISTTTLAIIVALEITMLFYSVINTPLYGEYVWRYRLFYIALLSVSVICMLLNIYVKRDVENRYKIMSIANPLCSVFFFAWSLGITYSDLQLTGEIDAIVFLTFSLTVPLSFFLYPSVYAAIVVAADVVMLYLTATTPGYVGVIINLSIFFIFQFVLGIAYLRLKIRLAERIVMEQQNAEIDVMTGFFNRRRYEADMKRMVGEKLSANMTYLAIDINGLKEVNDSCGHEAGDKLITGTARCMEKCFGDKGELYRVGGDEFVVLLETRPSLIDNLLADYEDAMKKWSGDNGLSLTASYGYVSSGEYPDATVTKLASVADERMYKSKAQYYQMKDKDRRAHNE